MSFVTSKLAPLDESEETSGTHSAFFAFNNTNDDAIDDTSSLAQIFGISSSADTKKDRLENYDDTLADVDLADEDDQLDKQVSALAQKVDKDPSAKIAGAKWLTESVQRGDNISSLFKDLNIPAATLMSIVDASKKANVKINNLSIGDKVSFLVGGDGELLVFIKPISKTEQLRFYKANDAGDYSFIREKIGSFAMDDDAVDKAKALAATPGTVKTETPKVTAPAATDNQTPKEMLASKRGRLVLVTIGKGQTFSQAANKAGITYSEINKILQMFKGKIQFSRNIRAGDTMRILFTQAQGKGKICAVEFNLARGGRVSSYLNTADGKYYDERGLNTTRSTFVRFPFRSRVRVTSKFNPSRLHPVTGCVRPHNGVDFGLPVGTPITAPGDGIIDKATYSRSAGYYIVVRHSGGLSTVYMHLSKLNVRPGQRVKQGAIIARSGNTGISTGPHLHYEVRVNGRPVNPMRINLDNRSYEVNAKARKAFAATVKKYKKELYQNNLIAKR
ncbi:MAG: peptidoglycan DD-metalloendopeptidase family protein [Aeromonadales bacterium]|nr:peptidoglycan DD-metalloendopeptidase family protein [Aeromonadales bacterium]